MTTSSPFGTPIWNWLINPPTKVIYVHSLPYSSAVPYKLDYMLEVAVLRIGIPWTFSFSFAYVRALRCPKFFAVLSAVTQKRSPMLPNFFALFVPLFCRLLPYEGTLMLPPFEMLVRSPVLLVLPYAQGSWWPKLSEYEFHLFLYATRRAYAGQKCVVLLTPFAYLVQCLKRV